MTFERLRRWRLTFYSYEVLIWFGPKFLKTTEFSLEEVEAVKTAILKEYPSAKIVVYKTLKERTAL